MVRLASKFVYKKKKTYDVNWERKKLVRVRKRERKRENERVRESENEKGRKRERKKKMKKRGRGSWVCVGAKYDLLWENERRAKDWATKKKNSQYRYVCA